MSSDPGILEHPISQGLYYAVLCTIPFHYWRQVTPFIPVDWYLTLFLVAILAIYCLSEKQMPPLWSNNLNKWFALFFLVNFIATLLSPYQEAAAGGMVVLVQVYIFIVINLAFLTEKGVFNTLPVVIAFSAGLNGLIAGMDYFLGYTPFYEKEFTRGAYGLTLGANNLSLMSVFVIPPMVHKLLNAESPPRFFFYLFLLLSNLTGLISSESRGGFLIFFVMATMVLIANRHRFHPRFFGLAISSVALMILVFTMAIPDQYFSRQQTIFSDAPDVSFQRRAAYIRVALDSFSKNPMLGTGPDSFPQVWINSRESLFFQLDERGVHNTYLNTLVGSGIVGLLAFFGLLFRIFRDFMAAIGNFDLIGDALKKEMTIAYLISFLTVLAYCLLKTLVDHKYFILVLSLSQVVWVISERQKARAYGLE